MKTLLLCMLGVAFLAGNGAAHAQSNMAPYASIGFLDDMADIKWEAGTAFAGTTVLGFSNWQWGSQRKWVSNSEGWFSARTRYGGTDKLGHSFTGYALTNVLTERLVLQGRSPEQAARTSAIFSSGLLLYVEVMDGYSRKYGFSHEDMTMNFLGAAFAYARHAVPGMRDLVDFRMEYEPSKHKEFDPIGDYAGQKYLLALKLSGTDAFRNTPMRYLELQAGYYARHFGNVECDRYSFVGIGINLSEVFFGRRKPDDSGMRRLGRGFFEHIQIPHTAIRSDWRY